MRYLLAIPIVVLLTGPAYAGDPAPNWLTQPSGGVTVLHPHDRLEYWYDDKGHSATIYGNDPGMRWYSTTDAHTGKQTQGYFYDPMPRRTPTTPLSIVPTAPMYPPTDRR
jgi:hypothetical protein